MKVFIFILQFALSFAAFAQPLIFLQRPADVGASGGGGGSDVTNGIVGWWKFNEGSGTSAADSSGQSHDITLNEGSQQILWTNGAVRLNGSIGQHGTIANPSTLPSATNALTISFWENNEFTAARYALTWGENSTGKGMGFIYNSGWIMENVGTSTPAGATVPTNEWHHVVGTSTGTNMDVFVDGVHVKGPTAITPSSPTGTVVGYLGQSWGGTFLWVGSFDDVRIYNRVLSTNEIYQVTTNGLAQPGGHGL